MGSLGQRVLNLIALIPHPTYGNYGGNYKGCKDGICKEPVDPLDEAYQKHDYSMHTAELLNEIWAVKTSDMKHKVWGNVHRSLATAVFWPLVKLHIIE